LILDELRRDFEISLQISMLVQGQNVHSLAGNVVGSTKWSGKTGSHTGPSVERENEIR